MARLFLALDPSEAQREAFQGVRSDAFEARWTPSQQYHLTLRFIGDATPSEQGALQERLSNILHPPCRLAGAGLGSFPSLRSPRVLWARVDPAPELITLQAAADKIATELGFPPARHDFTPHITLARLKDADPTRVYEFIAAHRSWSFPAHEAEEIILYDSTLTARGAVHTVVDRYALPG